MRPLSIIYILCLLYTTTSIAQTDKFNIIESSYGEFFALDQETIFTHVNKSKYLPSEQLWFKSYIYNTKTLLPYVTTTNVYAEIFDDSGQLITKKLCYAEDGMTYGNFDLTKKFTPGFYFLKVTTNWMKNFKNEHSSVQQFEIIGNDNEQASEIISERHYDFQLLPEGGKILNDASNTIGFKILNNQGKGVKIASGKLIDTENNSVSTFVSNDYGMGKFEVFIDAKKPLSVSVTLDDGTELTKKIVPTDLRGIAISINNLNPDRLYVNLKTNVSTLPELLKQQFYLVIHRDGLLKKVDFNFESNKLDYVISIPKVDLFDGINILTLFNADKKPFLERIVFNETNKLFAKIELLGRSVDSDSTTIRLRSSIKDTISRNISISVLPASTKSYDQDNNIYSSFLLEPYVAGTIENPSHYFKDQDRKTIYDLDLLLLTQGWSSYSWNSIFLNPQKPYYNFESGIEIKGKINSNIIKKGSEVVLVSKDNQLIVTETIDAENNFNFNNLFLLDSTSISLSIQDKKQQLSYSGLYYTIYPKEFTDILDLNNVSIKRKANHSYIDNDFKFIYNDIVSLDTVSIRATRKKPKNKPVYRSFNSELVDLESTYVPTSLILEIIRQNGFDVIQKIDDIQILSRSKITFSGGIPPTVYIDNAPLNGYFTDLQYMTVQEVDELFISTSPSVNSLGGNIHIFTKKTFESGSLPSAFNSSTINTGFIMPQKYSSPMYNKSDQKLFAEYGVLHWIPNIKMDKNGEFVFKISNYMYDNIHLYIEGMSSDGSLISKTERIDLNGNMN